MSNMWDAFLEGFKIGFRWVMILFLLVLAGACAGGPILLAMMLTPHWLFLYILTIPITVGIFQAWCVLVDDTAR